MSLRSFETLKHSIFPKPTTFESLLIVRHTYPKLKDKQLSSRLIPTPFSRTKIGGYHFILNQTFESFMRIIAVANLKYNALVLKLDVINTPKPT